MYIYKYIYVCMYVCMYVCVRVYGYVYIYICTCNINLIVWYIILNILDNEWKHSEPLFYRTPSHRTSKTLSPEFTFTSCGNRHGEPTIFVRSEPTVLIGLFHGKSQSKVDDDWGYLHFRKPPWNTPKNIMVGEWNSWSHFFFLVQYNGDV